MSEETKNIPEVIEEAEQKEAAAPEEAKNDNVSEPSAAPEPAETEEPSSEPEASAENNASAETIENLRYENSALKAGVKAECVADVIALAKSRVTETVTPEQAIEQVCEAYPSFKGSAVPNITTSARTTNEDISEADDTLIDRIMGIK